MRRRSGLFGGGEVHAPEEVGFSVAHRANPLRGASAFESLLPRRCLPPDIPDVAGCSLGAKVGPLISQGATPIMGYSF